MVQVCCPHEQVVAPVTQHVERRYIFALLGQSEPHTAHARHEFAVYRHFSWKLACCADDLDERRNPPHYSPAKLHAEVRGHCRASCNLLIQLSDSQETNKVYWTPYKYRHERLKCAHHVVSLQAHFIVHVDSDILWSHAPLQHKDCHAHHYCAAQGYQTTSHPFASVAAVAHEPHSSTHANRSAAYVHELQVSAGAI